MEQVTSQILNWADSSFKYILIAFNFMTLIVVYIHKSRQKIKKQHHVLFVTAHPDDEVMYFRPSLTSITKDYFVHLLCLSGKGTERQQELKKSAQKLKLHKLQCIDNYKLKDSMECEWPKQEIRQIVLKYILENSIKAIFTFDSHGVSGHSNHKAIGLALKQLHYSKEQLKVLKKKAEDLNEQDKMRAQLIKNESIKIYHLNSVSLIRKYTGILEIVFALLRDFSWININIIDAFNSMAVHKSQFLWYRKLWIFFSQYSYINIYSVFRIKKNANKSQNGNKDSAVGQITEESENKQRQEGTILHGQSQNQSKIRKND